MEQYTRFELVLYPWQGHVLPLHQYCIEGALLITPIYSAILGSSYEYYLLPPIIATSEVVVWEGVEPSISRLSVVRSDQLSYQTIYILFNLYKYYNINFYKCQIFFLREKMSDIFHITHFLYILYNIFLKKSTFIS